MAKLVTPELDKQHRIIASGKSALIQEFLDWLPTQGLHIMELDAFGQPFAPNSPHQIMADFFEIDLDKIEQERRWVLENLRGEA